MAFPGFISVYVTKMQPNCSSTRYLVHLIEIGLAVTRSKSGLKTSFPYSFQPLKMVLVKGLGLIELQETSFGKQVNISDDIIDLLILHLKAQLSLPFGIKRQRNKHNT